MHSRDVESAEYFLLPLPAPYEVSRFHIPAPCFMKNASTSVSLKCQMLPSSLPAFSECFRFHKNLTASTSLLHATVNKCIHIIILNQLQYY